MSHETSSVAETRADGPSAVRAGPVDAPTVLVLDPAGEAKNGRLPATWRPVAEQLRVVWCRLPASLRQGSTGHELVREFRETTAGMHLVAGGPAARPALALAMGCAEWVRSVVLVDPPEPEDPELSALADELAALRVPVQLVLTASKHTQEPAGEHTPGQDGPLPLGHPDVVTAAVQTLLAVETELAAGRPKAADDAANDTARPQRPLAVEALHAVLGAVRSTPAH